jgi:hypothetical protein
MKIFRIKDRVLSGSVISSKEVYVKWQPVATSTACED